MRMKLSKFTRYLVRSALILSFLLPEILRLGVMGTAQPAQAAPANPKIQHIIFIVKENHTFDSYFGTFPGADIPPNGQGKVKVGNTVQTIDLRKAHDRPANYNHEWQTANEDYDNGQMDAFNVGEANPNPEKDCSRKPYRCYVTGDQSLIPGYWDLAQHFVLADKAFSSVRGPSFPNHLYTVAAAGGPTPDQSAINNPNNHGTAPRSWGCDANPKTTVELYSGMETGYPCFGCPQSFCLPHVTTLADEMDAKGISWKYYTPMGADPSHVLNTLGAFYQYRNSPKQIVSERNFDQDVSNGTLPAFSWLIPPARASEHPSTSTCEGENWTLEKINEVKNNKKLWDSSVIALTWDDFGGLYDHVEPPTTADKLGYGFRVPLLIISPFAHPHISHTLYDFTSVLKFAEETFGLNPLSQRDKNANSIAADLDLTSPPNTAPIPQPRSDCAIGPEEDNSQSILTGETGTDPQTANRKPIPAGPSAPNTSTANRKPIPAGASAPNISAANRKPIPAGASALNTSITNRKPIPAGPSAPNTSTVNRKPIPTGPSAPNTISIGSLLEEDRAIEKEEDRASHLTNVNKLKEKKLRKKRITGNNRTRVLKHRSAHAYQIAHCHREHTRCHPSHSSRHS